MAYGLMVLDGLTFDYNPVKAANLRIRVVAESPTLLGRVLTDWGTDASRQDIPLTWPVMDADFFAALNAKALAGGTLSFTDDDGTAYTVIAIPPTFEAKTPGGDAYMNVVMTLKIASSP